MLGDFFLDACLLEGGNCIPLEQVCRTIFLRGERPKWKKKTQLPYHCVYHVWGQSRLKKVAFLWHSPHERAGFQPGKGTFYLNSKQWDLWPCVPLASAALHGSVSTSVYGMKVCYIKLLPCITFNNRWRLVKSPV